MKYFPHETRVYYENTDAGGIVYHGQYLNFAERGRTEFLRHIGFESRKLMQDHGILFVARYLDIDYFLPAFLDDLLEVRTSISELKNSSFTMRQIFIRNDEKIAELKVTLVCVDENSVRPKRVPDFLRNGFGEYLEGNEG